jgi:hypothetical protein
VKRLAIADSQDVTATGSEENVEPVQDQRSSRSHQLKEEEEKLCYRSPKLILLLATLFRDIIKSRRQNILAQVYP